MGEQYPFPSFKPKSFYIHSLQDRSTTNASQKFKLIAHPSYKHVKEPAHVASQADWPWLDAEFCKKSANPTIS